MQSYKWWIVTAILSVSKCQIFMGDFKPTTYFIIVWSDDTYPEFNVFACPIWNKHSSLENNRYMYIITENATIGIWSYDFHGYIYCYNWVIYKLVWQLYKYNVRGFIINWMYQVLPLTIVNLMRLYGFVIYWLQIVPYIRIFIVFVVVYRYWRM